MSLVFVVFPSACFAVTIVMLLSAIETVLVAHEATDVIVSESTAADVAEVARIKENFIISR